MFQNESKNKKYKFEPVSILPTVSKIFENILSYQLPAYFENILWESQSGFH